MQVFGATVSKVPAIGRDPAESEQAEPNDTIKGQENKSCWKGVAVWLLGPILLASAG